MALGLFPGLYNKRQFDEAGLPTPDTWDDLKAGRVSQKRGHPVGVAISHCNDANHLLVDPLVLRRGGGEADGKTVVMRTPE